jgi:hypothetical protein
MPDPEELDTWSSTECLHWIATLTEQSAPTDLNWWLRARIAPQRRAYNRTSPPDVRRDWALVFLSLVDSSETFANLNHWTAATDAATIRALLINELGPIPGDTPWDPAALTQRVLATTTLRPEAAADLAREWKTLPRQEILLLRRHKNLLTPLTTIIDQLPHGRDRDHVEDWYAVLPNLP